VQILPQHARTQEVREMPFQLGEQCLFAGYRVTATLIADKKLTKDLIVDRNFTNHLLDYDKIKGTIVLRSRVSGDRIQLAGRDFTVSIKKQIQEKVPLHRRQTLHFLADEAGTIFAEGIGIADRVKPEAGVTQQLLVVSIEKIQQADCCAISDEEKE
jgi:tRNA(Ile)-lysidine synthase